MRRPLVKVCGLRDRTGLEAAAGADFVGFVFFPASPRAVTPAQALGLAAAVPAGARRVGLFVDPDDAIIEAALPAVDAIQLHGAEAPERAAAIRARFGRPVIKALGIGGEADLAAIPGHAAAADMLLLDARPAALPGGNGARFDWALPRRLAIPIPWLLAGGLDPANVAAALRESGADGVDVSSGVERARGEKDPALVRAFVAAARSG